MTKLLETELRKSGAVSPGTEIYNTAVGLLQRPGGSPTTALPEFVRWLVQKCPVVPVVFGEQEIGQAAMRYLKARTDEMAGKPAGGGHVDSESHGRTAPATNSRPGGHHAPENLGRAATPGGKAGGEGHSPAESQVVTAHPLPSRDDRGRFQRTLQTASRSFWDMKIGVIDVRIGDLTRHHVETLDRQVSDVGHVVRRLRTEVEWPDDVTPVEKFADMDQIREIVASGRRLIGNRQAEAIDG